MRFCSAQWWIWDRARDALRSCASQDGEPAAEVLGPRVALLVHGFQADHRFMMPLASYLADFRFRNESRTSYGYYASVLVFEYDSCQYSIEHIVHQFVHSLQPLLHRIQHDNWQCELFAHSLGGIICRHALKYGGLIEHMHRLVMFGTPNHGVPTPVIRSFTRFLSVAKFGDLARSPILPQLECGRIDQPNQQDAAPFLLQLNRRLRSRRTQKAYAQRAVYYTMAGNEYLDMMPLPYSFGSSLGWLLNRIYSWLSRTTGEHDGLIAVHSVHSPILMDESVAWRNTWNLSLVPLMNHQVTLPVNHASMLGIHTRVVSPGQSFLDAVDYEELPDCVQIQLDAWLETWSS